MDRTTSELEFHQVFERITDAYVALDRDWRYIYLNAKACEFFGRRVEDLIGRHIWTEFPDGEGQPFRKHGQLVFYHIADIDAWSLATARKSFMCASAHAARGTS